MFNKKFTCLLPVRVISVISKYVNHHSYCSPCIICDNNQNESMNGNQQGITLSELMSLCTRLNIMHYNPDWLELENSDLSEGDYGIKVWGDIIENIFRDNQLSIKWGETVSIYSSDVKSMNESATSRRKIGDKVDFRVVLKRCNVDLLNGEIASNTKGTKYFHDNRKILRETKNIADQFYRSVYLGDSKAQSIQIAGTEGEITEVSLVDNGLYVNNRLGYLRLPSNTFDLDITRTLICRLLDVKKCILRLARMYRHIEKERDAHENGSVLRHQHIRMMKIIAKTI